MGGRSGMGRSGGVGWREIERRERGQGVGRSGEEWDREEWDGEEWAGVGWGGVGGVGWGGVGGVG